MISTPQTPRGSDRTASPARHYPRAQPRRQVFPWQLEPVPLCRRGKSIASQVHPIGLTLPQNCHACQPAYAHVRTPTLSPQTSHALLPCRVRSTLTTRTPSHSPRRRSRSGARPRCARAAASEAKAQRAGVPEPAVRTRACVQVADELSFDRPGHYSTFERSKRQQPELFEAGRQLRALVAQLGPRAVPERGRKARRRRPGHGHPCAPILAPILAPQTPRASPRTPNLACNCLSPRYKPPDAIPARKTRAHNPARLTPLAHPSAADPAHAVVPATPSSGVLGAKGDGVADAGDGTGENGTFPRTSFFSFPVPSPLLFCTATCTGGLARARSPLCVASSLNNDAPLDKPGHRTSTSALAASSALPSINRFAPGDDSLHRRCHCGVTETRRRLFTSRVGSSKAPRKTILCRAPGTVSCFSPAARTTALRLASRAAPSPECAFDAAPPRPSQHRLHRRIATRTRAAVNSRRRAVVQSGATPAFLSDGRLFLARRTGQSLLKALPCLTTSSTPVADSTDAPCLSRDPLLFCGPL
ncbi:hypothetical protein DFH07DRAFT_953741 [Mycena maculata]|uniref:Uncharacterized protein n=1 Tax=Mycena maculata TaxID=230809 RepID=A0AAD7NQT0_9AGAR|nr:hypothetical protein DFH07DRAFT_953741 [Mycena maculata]